MTRQEAKAHDKKAHGKFIALSDHDSENDFTDNGSTYSPSNASSKNSKSNIVS